MELASFPFAQGLGPREGGLGLSQPRGQDLAHVDHRRALGALRTDAERRGDAPLGRVLPVLGGYGL
eukprot:13453558-Alexandrium_andersonii.AAC.1